MDFNSNISFAFQFFKPFANIDPKVGIFSPSSKLNIFQLVVIYFLNFDIVYFIVVKHNCLIISCKVDIKFRAVHLNNPRSSRDFNRVLSRAFQFSNTLCVQLLLFYFCPGRRPRDKQRRMKKFLIFMVLLRFKYLYKGDCFRQSPIIKFTYQF